jgi:hypothetical protein
MGGMQYQDACSTAAPAQAGRMSAALLPGSAAVSMSYLMTSLQLLKLLLQCCLLSNSDRPLPEASFAVIQHIHARHADLMSTPIRARAASRRAYLSCIRC